MSAPGNCLSDEEFKIQSVSFVEGYLRYEALKQLDLENIENEIRNLTIEPALLFIQTSPVLSERNKSLLSFEEFLNEGQSVRYFKGAAGRDIDYVIKNHFKMVYLYINISNNSYRTYLQKKGYSSQLYRYIDEFQNSLHTIYNSSCGFQENSRSSSDLVIQCFVRNPLENHLTVFYRNEFERFHREYETCLNLLEQKKEAFRQEYFDRVDINISELKKFEKLLRDIIEVYDSPLFNNNLGRLFHMRIDQENFATSIEQKQGFYNDQDNINLRVMNDLTFDKLGSFFKNNKNVW